MPPLPFAALILTVIALAGLSLLLVVKLGVPLPALALPALIAGVALHVRHK